MWHLSLLDDEVNPLVLRERPGAQSNCALALPILPVFELFTRRHPTLYCMARMVLNRALNVYAASALSLVSEPDGG